MFQRWITRVGCKMLIFLKKAWEWIKKYWKWILFPIGILVAVAGFIAGRSSRKTTPPVMPPDLGDVGERAVDEIIAADEERDRKLEELRLKNQARLEELSSEQQEELDQLKDKPLEEVVAWFDRL